MIRRGLLTAVIAAVVFGATAQAQGPANGMAARLDNCNVSADGYGIWIRCSGWAVHDYRVKRQTPRVVAFIDRNFQVGYGPVIATQRTDVCPAIFAWWGWFCAAARTMMPLGPGDWWGHSPSANLPWDGDKPGIDIMPFKISHLDFNEHTIQVAIYESAPGEIGQFTWSNDCQFYRWQTGPVQCP